MKKLFLLDAYALIYSSHFAFIKNPLVNSKGLNVSAITGFVNKLWEVLQKEEPTHIAVAFDLPKPTFRHKMYKPYKAHRDEQPEDITLALPYIKNIIKGFNIPVVACEGYEADDVIGTLAKQAEKEGFEVYMVTPDKDYAQLVSEHIYLYKPARFGKGIQIYDKQKVLDKWKIERVEQIIDILGLQGDASDNIPGIRGVGIKTAQKLLKKFGSIENILENTDQIKGKMGEKVEKGREDALISKKLATIDVNVPIEFNAEVYKVDPLNREALTEVFTELEFRTISKRILGSGGKQKDLFGNATQTKGKKKKTQKFSIVANNIENTEHTYQLVDTPKKRQALISQLQEQSIICFDTETTGLNPNEAELVGIAFCCKDHEANYVPIPADQEEAQAIINEFKDILENKEIAKIGQNIKYDMLILRWYDIEVQGKLWDTMVVHYIIEPEKRHNLTYLSETYLNYAPVPIETLIGKKGKNQLSMRDAPIDKVKEYAGEDADLTWRLHHKLLEEASDEVIALYEEIEEPLIPVLVDIEYNGFNLDVDFLQAYSEEIGKDIEAVKKKIFEQAGLKTFNLDSPRQIGDVLFDKLELPYRWRKTKTGQYSTSESKLSELSEEYEIVQDILNYRSLAKLKSTYVDALPKLVNPKTGRIHSSFNQALTATGRLSSQNPNLQNIPIRTERGRQIRKAFIPKDENYVLIAADYSQIELRIVAEISGDKAMLEAFQSGQDIHAATAAKIYKVAIDEVTKEQRYNAKTVNFSIVYGAGATNLSKNLDIKRSEATELIQQYFEEYKGLKKYMEEVVNQAREDGFVTTFKGRRRYLRSINSRNSMMRSGAERTAINTPIQGTAADMIKLAMIKISKALKENELQTKMISQVHDELIFDVPKAEIDQAKQIIEENMKNALEGLSVPILVGIGTGKHWLEAH